jgi:Rrf2 family protein
VPEGYLAKVLRSLALAELVRSQRGPQGGSVLARPAKQITVYDVVQAVDPIRRITSCPLGIREHGVNLCPLHRRLDQAIAMVEEAFKNTTIAELVSTPTGPQSLCDLPAPRRGGRARA